MRSSLFFEQNPASIIKENIRYMRRLSYVPQQAQRNKCGSAISAENQSKRKTMCVSRQREDPNSISITNAWEKEWHPLRTLEGKQILQFRKSGIP